jgi:Putative peptidoglycan binding domain
MRLGSLALVAAVALAACSSPSQEELGRRAVEEGKASSRALDAAAHEQKIDPETVKRVQQELTTLKEYMGPITGKLDPVTLNAFEAFQRSRGMDADGMMTDDALSQLTEAASKQHSPS